MIPTHDTREMTLRCVAAVVATTPAATEVVVVDDGSADGTADAVRARYPGAVVVGRPERGGFTPAANDGLARAGGDLVLLLNSDAVVEPGAVAALAAAFDDDALLGAAGAVLLSPDGSPQWSGGPAPTALWLLALASGAGRLLSPLRPRRGGGTPDWLSGAALMLRRRALDDTGPLDAALGFYAQDADLCLRLRDRGWTLRRVDAARVVHVGGASIGRHDGAVGSQHPGLLWTSLVRLAAKRGGRRAGRRAALALRLGATLRVVARCAVAPLLPRGRRAGWTADTAAYRAARADVIASS